MFGRVFPVLLFLIPTLSLHAQNDSALVILQRYATAWRGEREMQLHGDAAFGFHVTGDGGGDFTVRLTSSNACVERGLIENLEATFSTDIETLQQIDRGELTAMTALARALARIDGAERHAMMDS